MANSHWLYKSWRHIQSPDTDLVFMGPKPALEKLPDDVLKVVQEPATADPAWLDYGYVNSVACFADPSASIFDDYDIILRTDVDTFLTPAWNSFYPQEFIAGRGRYNNDDRVRDNILRIAQKFGLTHRGAINIGSTHYGPPSLVQDICRLITELTRYIRTVEFKDHEGEWPSWYFGVSSLYATEIAVNHLVPSFWEPCRALDYDSSSSERVDYYPHIHCWHVHDVFSKFRCFDGEYDQIREEDLDLTIINEYCLSMALRARRRVLGAAGSWQSFCV